ncbi:MarR family transcriptional regulator [Streptomyces monashensis]|uniref:helix-turn-helix domain-containing protein n=1 Tax=Streptomyces monashensis TaxID=1678012 RepID=UPI0033EB21CE
MLIQASAGFGMLYRLDLTKAATDLLSVLIERQEPGGEVNASQAQLAARVGLSRNSANTAMALLESRNLVLRPTDSEGRRRYRAYYLHPYIASYATQEELEEAIQDAAERIAEGELPEITAPLYETAPPKRQPQGLKPVRAAG